MEDCGLGMLRIDRKSSIETEPRTLSIDQIHNAREAALYVVNTRSVEDAVTIFTQGLEPVVSVGKHGGSTMDPAEESHWNQSLLQIREIASAPF